MSRFVQEANLPHHCSAVLYGEKYAGNLEKPLKKLGISSILMPDNPDVDPRLSGHVDLSVLHTGGERGFLAPFLKGSSLADDLEAAGASLVFPDVRQTAVYPSDAMLNVCVFGKRAICNPKTAAREIVDSFTSRSDSQLAACRQGYSRCACCPVERDAVITADRGIAKAAAAGLSALLISEGFVRLDGFPYGFIGGAAFKLADNKLAFTGRLDGHPDRDRILLFLAAHGIEAVFLTENELFDIGSAIPIFEE